jgi:hypothetical protein
MLCSRSAIIVARALMLPHGEEQPSIIYFTSYCKSTNTQADNPPLAKLIKVIMLFDLDHRRKIGSPLTLHTDYENKQKTISYAEQV